MRAQAPFPRAARTLRVTLVAVALVASAAAAQKSAKFDRLDLTNLLLGPDYQQWLVGPIARMATEDERRSYLSLASDDAAEAFIESFWAKPERAAVRRVFDQRAEEADKRYTEGTYVGSRTDRGTIYVLHGEPEHSEYEQHRNLDDPDIERWTYPKKAEKGLDGQKPRRSYRFAKEGEVTEFFVSQGVDQRKRSLERRLRGERDRTLPF